MSFGTLHTSQFEKLFFNNTVFVNRSIFFRILDFDEKERVTVSVSYNNVNTACDCVRTASGILMLDFNSFWCITQFIDKLGQEIRAA